MFVQNVESLHVQIIHKTPPAANEDNRKISFPFTGYHKKAPPPDASRPHAGGTPRNLRRETPPWNLMIRDVRRGFCVSRKIAPAMLTNFVFVGTALHDGVWIVGVFFQVTAELQRIPIDSSASFGCTGGAFLFAQHCCIFVFFMHFGRLSLLVLCFWRNLWQSGQRNRP